MINYKSLLGQLPFDINAEALAACLFKNSPEMVDSGQIMIRPLGHINRVTGTEVFNIAGSVYNTEGKELLFIDINREGLYDSLPEMLFMQLDATYEDEIEKAQHLARKAELGRQFFLPFEETLYRTRIDMELAERAAVKELAAFLLDIYGLDNLNEYGDNQEQMVSFALVLPFMHRVVGDLALTGSLLTNILRQKVRITPEEQQPYCIPDALQTCMGNSLLGVDFMLGATFSDGIRRLQVAVCDVLPEEVENWLPGGNKRHLLEEQLFPFILAAGEQAEISIEIIDTQCHFYVGDDDNGKLNILGYTTRIN